MEHRRLGSGPHLRAALVNTGMGHPGEDAGQRFSPVQRLLEQAVADGAFPGAAWGVVQAGVTLATGAVGRHTYEASSPRATTGTVYDLASVSKVVATTAMAMLLYERGLLDLDMLLGDLLPGFVIASRPGERRREVTLRMLLAHCSGLPGYAPFFLRYRDAPALLRACLQEPLEALPGSRAEYSDIGFILLGKALELIAEERLDSYCKREVFQPLGMESTLYHPPASERAAIPPTERDEVFRHAVVQGQVHDENCFVLGGCAGHAGLFAPVGDVLLFAESILAPLRARPAPSQALFKTEQALFKTEQALLKTATAMFKAATVRLFITRSELPAGSSRALGWDTPSGEPSSFGSHFGPRPAGHLGYTGTSLWIDPDRDLGVVLLTNRTWPTRANKRIQQVRPAFHDALAKLL